MTRPTRRAPQLRSLAVALATVTVAVAGIVLLRAQASTVHRPEPRPIDDGGASSLRFDGPGLRGQAGFAQGAVLLGGTRRVDAEIRLSAAGSGATRRQPVALSVVLDVSGSMSGEKIEGARRAVRELLEGMHDGDRVALVVYNHEARVLEPLTPIRGARSALGRAVEIIEAGGGTDIPAGLEEGTRALRGAPDEMVRRVVLISDGLDGSGRDLSVVGAELSHEADRGVSISSLGVGVDYDERFLTRVADAGRGNYAFLASGAELRGFLRRELEQATATVLDSVVAELRLPPGFRLVEAHGVDAEGRAGTVRLPIGAIAADASRSVLLTLEVEADAEGPLGDVAVSVTYRTTGDGEKHRVAPGSIALVAASDADEVVASYVPGVRAQTEAARIDRRQAEALEAWRRGDRERASSLARDNLAALHGLAASPPEAAPVVQEQLQAAEREASAYRTMSADSEEGRALGLRSNADRRTRALH